MTDTVKIPLLTAEDIECRVQSVIKSGSGAGAILLLYKNARVDMRILDEVFGTFGWQRKHQLINGNLFCTISIFDSKTDCWIDKEDVGTESNTEKEKGQASDAFKRAGFNVGIGRELYTAPFIWVSLNSDEWSDAGGKARVNSRVKFTVKDISYNERREITALSIVDGKGNIRYQLGAKATQKASQKPQKEESEESKLHYLCSACGQEIHPVGKTGKPISIERYIKASLDKFGKPLCMECARKANG